MRDSDAASRLWKEFEFSVPRNSGVLDIKNNLQTNHLFRQLRCAQELEECFRSFIGQVCKFWRELQVARAYFVLDLKCPLGLLNGHKVMEQGVWFPNYS